MICVIVPSRGRPERARSMVTSVRNTADGEVGIRLVIDADDPSDYTGVVPVEELVVMPERVGYSRSLNAVALSIKDEFTILGAFGDDVQFTTQGWDRVVETTLATPGIAYGDDLVHAAGHPTAVFMSSEIVTALGYLAIPQSRHLWVDDAWKLLGQKTGTLRYMAGTVFEHLHPAVGKAEFDKTYAEVYDSVLGHNDHLGFLDWQENHAESDAAKVRAIL